MTTETQILREALSALNELIVEGRKLGWDAHPNLMRQMTRARAASHALQSHITTPPAPAEVPAASAGQGEPVAYIVPTAKHAADGSYEGGPDYLEWADEASDYEKRVGKPLYTHPAAVPDGYVLVPVEPTQAMLNVQTWDFSRFYSPREIWDAMLAAKKETP